MTPERWQRAKEIFHSALDRAPGERSGFLADACGDDESLRQEVESLISSHEKAGSFIDSPAYEASAGLVVNEKTELRPGQVIGSYEIISFISRGGTINIWTAAIAGGEQKQLTFDNELMGFPSWSPDGQFLVFETKRGDDAHVFIMPSTGGTPAQLTFDHGQSWPYSWSPDRDKIAFAGLRNGIWNMYWVSRSTKEQ